MDIFFFRRDISGRLCPSANSKSDPGFILKSCIELLAEDSVISTFRVSAAEPARAPG